MVAGGDVVGAGCDVVAGAGGCAVVSVLPALGGVSAPGVVGVGLLVVVLLVVAGAEAAGVVAVAAVGLIGALARCSKVKVSALEAARAATDFAPSPNSARVRLMAAPV